jgi:hypothetical protein
MALDPNISLGVRPLQVPDPLAQMAQVSQIQSSQRQNEAAQMQLEQLKQDRIEMQQFQSQIVANGGNADLDLLAKTMLKTPKFFAQGVELTKKLKEQAEFETVGKRLYPELFGATAPVPSAMGQGAAPVAQNALGTGTEPVNALAPTPAPTAAPVNALAAPASEPYPGYNQAIGMTSPAAPARTQQLSSSGKTRQQLEGLIFMAQKNPLFKGMAETAKLELAEMMKAPVYHNVPGVGLVNPITKETVVPSKAAPPTPLNVTRLIQERDALPKGHPNIPIYNAAIRKETEFAPRADAASTGKAPAGYRYTANNELEPIPGGPAAPGLSPKDIQKREAVFPQATSSVKSFETRSEQFIKELEKLRDDPGLNQITGAIYGRTPSVSREGSRAQALYDKIFAKGGFQALQDMREASKTGGALGNVSNEEGRRLEKSVVGGLDRTQNIDDVKQGINDFIDEIRVSQARVREAYDTTYAYKGDKTPATSALSSVDQQALQWANSNPADPRAAAIKQRLGK